MPSAAGGEPPQRSHPNSLTLLDNCETRNRVHPPERATTGLLRLYGDPSDPLLCTQRAVRPQDIDDIRRTSATW